jgi:phage shock protein PspC (stress-responsive transcriptional regulator)
MEGNIMKKRLTKSRNNVVISGTLAGLAEYFGIDPTIVRIGYVVISLLGIGSPVLLYIILMAIIPKASSNGGGQSYGRQNPYYQANNAPKKERKDVTNSVKEETTEDDWSDF